VARGREEDMSRASERFGRRRFTARRHRAWGGWPSISRGSVSKRWY
jgi:hypothetical protein